MLGVQLLDICFLFGRVGRITENAQEYYNA